MTEDFWKRQENAVAFETYWNKEHRDSLDRRWRLVQRLVGNLSYTTLLDIGCGMGNLIGFTSLATKNNYCGLDISPLMIARARSLHPGYRFKVVNPMDLSTHSDLVVAHGFLLHQHDLFLKLHKLIEFTGTCLIFDILVTGNGYSGRSPKGYWTRILGNEEYVFMKRELSAEFFLEEVEFAVWGDNREYFLRCERILKEGKA